MPDISFDEVNWKTTTVTDLKDLISKGAELSGLDAANLHYFNPEGLAIIAEILDQVSPDVFDDLPWSRVNVEFIKIMQSKGAVIKEQHLVRCLMDNLYNHNNIQDLLVNNLLIIFLKLV